jgi:CheY-like chemotaxis protein
MPTANETKIRRTQRSTCCSRQTKRGANMILNTNPPATTGKKRILVVDDRASDTQLMKLYLEQTNDYEVWEENNAKAALPTAERFDPHLILLDVMMPGMGGAELAACFKESSKLKDVPIVFLTALVTKGELDATHGRIGKFPFLAKPVVLTEMVACIKLHLDR